MKKIIAVLFVFFLAFFSPVSVYASGVTESDNPAEDGKSAHCTSGVVSFNWTKPGQIPTGIAGIKEDYNFKYKRTYDLSVDGEGSYLYLVVKDTDTLVTYFLCGKGQLTNVYGYAYEFWNTELKTVEQRVNPPSSSNIQLKTGKLSPDNQLFTYRKDLDTDYKNMECEFGDIPVFAYGDVEHMDNYEKTGNRDGSLNPKDIVQDSNIELPRNFRITGGYTTGISNAYSLDKDMIMSWNQTVDTSDYLYDIDMQLVMECTTHSGSATGTGATFSSGWTSFASSAHYDSATQIVRKFTDKELNDKLMEKALSNYVKSTGKKLGYKEYMINSLKIRVRNRVGNSATNYVVTTIDYKGSTTTAVVEDENGDTVASDEYNGGDVSDRDDTAITSDFSLTGILDYIRSGFGLLGEYGLISLMSGVFLYIPASVWVLIRMAIAMTITVMLISLVKRFVFG